MRSGESRWAYPDGDPALPRLLSYRLKRAALREKQRQRQGASSHAQPVFEAAGGFSSEVKIDWGGLFKRAFLISFGGQRGLSALNK